MPGYACLLRGINVGGRRMRMEELLSVFVGLGHEHVATYIQTGNVVFSSRSENRQVLIDDAQREIAQRFAMKVHVVLRSADELDSIIGRNPFTSRCSNPVHLHVSLLATTPDVSAVELPAVPAPDELALDGAEIYLHCPNGLGHTTIKLPRMDNLLRTVSTTRNWNTVTTLAAMARAAQEPARHRP
ncbi:MAG: DUF1697 domain-containing protein [Acidimicrobiales bacterium]